MKVLSIEQMNRLKKLGVDVTPKAECIMYSSVGGDDYKLMYAESVCEDDIKAFTLQDVIELLPKIIHVDHIECYLVILQAVDGFFVQYSEKDCLEDDIIWFYNDNILDAAYEMLIWVIENGHLKTK